MFPAMVFVKTISSLTFTALFTSLCLPIVLAGCKPLTADELELRADQAMAAGAFESAYEYCQDLLSLCGEDTPSRHKRFKAALKSSECLARMGRFEEAVAAVKQLDDVFGNEVKHPDVLMICTILQKEGAPDAVIIDLLKDAAETWPEQKERLERLQKEIDRSIRAMRQIANPNE